MQLSVCVTTAQTFLFKTAEKVSLSELYIGRMQLYSVGFLQNKCVVWQHISTKQEPLGQHSIQCIKAILVGQELPLPTEIYIIHLWKQGTDFNFLFF